MTLLQCAAPPQNPCTKIIVGVVDIRFAPVEVLCAWSAGAAHGLVTARPALAISNVRRESRYHALSDSFMGQPQRRSDRAFPAPHRAALRELQMSAQKRTDSINRTAA